MRQIFVLKEGEVILGVFNDEEKANDYCQFIDKGGIEKHALNPRIPKEDEYIFRVKINDNESIQYVERAPGNEPEQVKNGIVTCFARTINSAITRARNLSGNLSGNLPETGSKPQEPKEEPKQREKGSGWYFAAVQIQGTVYCVDCCPIPLSDPEVKPIYEKLKLDTIPECEHCGKEHDYMKLPEE